MPSEVLSLSQLLQLVHSWNTGGEPELITVLHTDCMHVHRRKQFTILQLVQLSSVKSSLSFTPYDVYSSQSTLLVGGGRYKPATRMLSPCQRCRATAQRRTEAVAACSSSLYTDSVNTASNPCTKS